MHLEGDPEFCNCDFLKKMCICENVICECDCQGDIENCYCLLNAPMQRNPFWQFNPQWPLQCIRCEQHKEDVEERYSLGIYAGRFCEICWEESGYRKEGREGFDPLDAGENYDEDDY